MSLTVEVTEDDIKKGVPGEADACAIVRAVRRATGRRVVNIDGESVEIMKDDFYMALPKKAKQFVLDFDDGKDVEPFSFVLKGYEKKGK